MGESSDMSLNSVKILTVVTVACIAIAPATHGLPVRQSDAAANLTAPAVYGSVTDGAELVAKYGTDWNKYNGLLVTTGVGNYVLYMVDQGKKRGFAGDGAIDAIIKKNYTVTKNALFEQMPQGDWISYTAQVIKGVCEKSNSASLLEQSGPFANKRRVATSPAAWDKYQLKDPTEIGCAAYNAIPDAGPSGYLCAS